MRFKTRLADTVTDLNEYGQIKASIQPLLMQRAERWAAETRWRASSVDSVGSAAPVDQVDQAAPPVLGVDGCRTGWVGALLRATTYDVLVAADIASLVASARRAAPDLAVVAVDIPIGLPDATSRDIDVLARRRLPAGRKSSVFPTPSRAATEESTYAEANAANKRALGKGLSRQAFGILPKIVDVDAYVRGAPGLRILEAYLEVSFAELDPACVVPSKTTRRGVTARRAALAGAGLGPPAYLPVRVRRRRPPGRVRESAWTARAVRRRHGVLPSPTRPRSSPTASPPRSGSKG